MTELSCRFGTRVGITFDAHDCPQRVASGSPSSVRQRSVNRTTSPLMAGIGKGSLAIPETVRARRSAAERTYATACQTGPRHRQTVQNASVVSGISMSKLIFQVKLQ